MSRTVAGAICARKMFVGTVFAGKVLAAVVGFMPDAAHAELKDYQIARLIMLKSGCQLAKLIRDVKADRSAVFSGQCKNASHYPEGIVVICPDIDNNDERSCRIATESKRFDSLNLLQGADE